MGGMMRWNGFVATGAALGVATVLMMGNPSGARAQGAAAPPPRSMGFLDMVLDSLGGDVYAPGRWRELPFGTFFSEGWDEPWAGGPNGDGGAPRQGWLAARTACSIAWPSPRSATRRRDRRAARRPRAARGTYTALQLPPINRRFQCLGHPDHAEPRRLERRLPVRGADFALTPRFMLQESQNVSQSLDITFRMPTGDTPTATASPP